MPVVKPTADLIRVGVPEITIELRRSQRARRMTLRLSNSTGLATLTLPRRVSLGEAQLFAERQHDWLRKNMAKRPVRSILALGQTLSIRGLPVILAQGTGRNIGIDGETLLIPGDPARAARKLQGWLKAQARAELLNASQKYATMLGHPFSGITLRDTRSRWGSCSASGALMYSWRLILAPASVLDYVAAHEVAHLKVMNHSESFWAEVARLKPGYAADRDWLRKNGPSLHSFDFG